MEGVFRTINTKNNLSLTENEICKHLDGIQQIGVYPLLQDNKSWFVVADYDKQNWKEEAVTFQKTCINKNISI